METASLANIRSFGFYGRPNVADFAGNFEPKIA